MIICPKCGSSQYDTIGLVCLRCGFRCEFETIKLSASNDNTASPLAWVGEWSGKYDYKMEDSAYEKRMG